MDCRNKRMCVIGAGKSGLAAFELLQKKGAEVFLTNGSKIPEELLKSSPFLGKNFEETHQKCYSEDFDGAVVSPGVTGDNPLLIHLRKKGIPLFSEVEIALWWLPTRTKVIGITGTNGKSTVTAYLEHLLKKAGYTAKACGNIGTPVSAIVSSDETYDFLCLELSSYQLELTFSQKLAASILLNLQPDHLQRYGNMDEYLKAKWRIFALTQDRGPTVCEYETYQKGIHLGLPWANENLFLYSGQERSIKAQTFHKSSFNFLRRVSAPLSLYKELKNLTLRELTQGINAYSFCVVNPKSACEVTTNLFSPNQNKVSWDIKETTLKGVHNHFNLAAATLCAYGLGIEHGILEKNWKKNNESFAGLPHRLEVVSPKNQSKNIFWINDSKATNIIGVQVALEAQNKKVRLLVGGQSKGENFGDIKDILLQKTLSIYPFGQAGAEISQALKNNSLPLRQPSQTLESAMRLAFEESQDGDTILLSPGCASFDEFKNFEDRGEHFRKLIWKGM